MTVAAVGQITEQFGAVCVHAVDHVGREKRYWLDCIQPDDRNDETDDPLLVFASIIYEYDDGHRDFIKPVSMEAQVRDALTKAGYYEVVDLDGFHI